MELAFHIILACLAFGLAVCMVVTYMISEDLRKIAFRLSVRLEEVEAQKRREEEYRKEYIKAQEKAQAKITELVDKWIKDKNTLNVTDSPLDFPPTKKED